MTDGAQGDDNDEAHSDGPDTAAFDHYDWDGGDSPSIAVAEAVAAVTNRNVTTLPPVQEVVARTRWICSSGLGIRRRSTSPSSTRGPT